VRPADEVRVDQRCRFDDPGVGPSHALQVEAGGGMDDLDVGWRWCCRVCQRACGPTFRMRESWSSVWVVPAEWWTLIHREAVAGASDDWSTAPWTWRTPSWWGTSC
jgi:hypothetical protein